MTEETPTYGTITEADTTTTVSFEESSDFDLLKAEAEKELTKTDRFDVEARPGFQIEIKTNVDYKDFKRYQKAATRGARDVVNANALLLASMLLAEYTLAIFHHGKKLVDSEGDPINFRTEKFIESFGVHTAADAAAKFLGDGYCIALGNRITELSGYASEVLEVEDPTND